MRSHEITRMYLQCEPDEDAAMVRRRDLGRARPPLRHAVNRGEVFEKGVTPMRSFVVEPMQHERLFLAGDAAHIVPPTGAKGLNTAMADVYLLAHSLEPSTAATHPAWSGIPRRALERVWRVQHFSWWMTSMLHRFAGDDDFQMKIQLSQLRYTTASRAQATALAENYVGMPFITE